MTEPAETVLQAQEIQKSFYHPARIELLKSITLTVKRGESVAIIGNSGEGKSTLLHILGTLEPPCDGTLTIAGQAVTGTNRNTIRNKHLGFVFQSFHLLEDYTALENVLMPARIARDSVGKQSEAYRYASEMLDNVGLGDRRHFHTKLLSGGEKQRVAIARALCNDPDIILADEPSGNLDYGTSNIIHDLLLNLVRERNKSLITVTHNLELADRCSRRLRLIEGRLHEV